MRPLILCMGVFWPHRVRATFSDTVVRKTALSRSAIAPGVQM